MVVVFCVEAPCRSCAAEIVMRIVIGKSLSVLNTEIRLQPEPGMGRGGSEYKEDKENGERETRRREEGYKRGDVNTELQKGGATA